MNSCHGIIKHLVITGINFNAVTVKLNISNLFMETFVHRFLLVFFLFHLEKSHKRSDGDALSMKFEFVTGVGKW
jgi:hypothetical protein